MKSAHVRRRNRFIERDKVILQRAFGSGNVRFLGDKWFWITNFHLRSDRYEFSHPVVDLLGAWPEDLGERRGPGAGVQYFFTNRKLRLRDRRNPRTGWQTIQNTWTNMDPTGLMGARKGLMWVCIHLDYDPRRHTVANALAAVQLMLTDPRALR